MLWKRRGQAVIFCLEKNDSLLKGINQLIRGFIRNSQLKGGVKRRVFILLCAFFCLIFVLHILIRKKFKKSCKI